MSDLTRISETREWLRAWLAEGARGARVIAHAANEQRRNLERAQTFGSKRRAEYTRCVVALERCAKRLRATCTCGECTAWVRQLRGTARPVVELVRADNGTTLVRCEHGTYEVVR